MSSPRYTQEFRDEAVRQVTERNYPAKEIAERLGIALNTLYIWTRKARPALRGGYVKNCDKDRDGTEEGARLSHKLIPGHRRGGARK